MRMLLRLACCIVIGFLFGSPSGALVCQRLHVVVGGGGHGSTSVHRHWCAIGQPVVGRAMTSVHEHHAGFWYSSEGSCSGIPCPTLQPPTDFELRYAGGNPADTGGAIVFATPARGHISIRLFDVTGRQVHVLAEGIVAAGYHEVGFSTMGLDGGVYFCRMEARGFSATRKLILLR